MNATRPHLVWLLLLGVACTTEQPRTPAAGPRETALAIVAAGKAGDVERFGRLVTGTTLAEHRFAIACERFSKAVKARFPAAPASWSLPSVDEHLPEFYTGAHAVQSVAPAGKGRVSLTMRVTHDDSVREETWLLVREGDAWRAVLPGKGMIRVEERVDANGEPETVSVLHAPPAEIAGPRVDRITREAEALAGLAADVEDGRYDSLDEIDQRVDAIKKSAR